MQLCQHAHPAPLFLVGNDVGISYQENIGYGIYTVHQVFILFGIGEDLLDAAVSALVRLVIEASDHVVVDAAEVSKGLPESELLQRRCRSRMAVRKSHKVHICHSGLHTHAAHRACAGGCPVLPVGKLRLKLNMSFLSGVIDSTVSQLGVDLPQKSCNPLFLCSCHHLLPAKIHHARFIAGAKLRGDLHAKLRFKCFPAVLTVTGLVALHRVVHDISCSGAHVAIDSVKRDLCKHFF